MMIQGTNNVEEQAIHSDPVLPTDEERLEEHFQGLWDRVRQAGDLIVELRTQKGNVQAQLDKTEIEIRELQRELTNARKEILEKNALIKDLQQQMAREDGNILSNGDKEALAAKARELLARIEAYL
jgi:peptidoglycan hydrolase CwlO-like protein